VKLTQGKRDFIVYIMQTTERINDGRCAIESKARRQISDRIILANRFLLIGMMTLPFFRQFYFRALINLVFLMEQGPKFTTATTQLPAYSGL